MPRCARRISLFANEHCAEVVGEIRSPDQLAIRDVEALQFAFARQRIDAVAVHDRRAARPARSLHVAKRVVDFLFPKLLCIGGIERVQRFPAARIVEVENFATRHDRRCQSFTDLNSPDNLGIIRQFAWNGAAVRHTSRSQGSAPLRPIDGISGNCEQPEEINRRALPEGWPGAGGPAARQCFLRPPLPAALPAGRL